MSVRVIGIGSKFIINKYLFTAVDQILHFRESEVIIVRGVEDPLSFVKS